MAVYKRKRSGAVKKSNKNSKSRYSDSYDVIELSGKKEKKAEKKAVEPKKRKIAKPRDKSYRFILAFLLAFLLIISYAVTYMLHPVGVIEYINNAYTAIGSSGDYNIELSGGKAKTVVEAGNKFFVLTDTAVSCYNKNGKTVFENAHNFANPIVKAGDTRYIMYDQGEREISVCTLDKTLFKRSFESGIICASVSHSGGYVVATKADGYESSVTVFNKKNKKIYEWLSPDETVNAVALSKNGKRLAVATLKVENGKFVSAIYVFKFNSADPIVSYTYSDEVVYSLEAVSDSNFCATFDDSIEFINYKKKTMQAYPSEYSVSMIKQFSNRVIAVRTVSANQDEGVVEVYSNNGKLISSFKVNSYVTDFSYKSGNLFLLGHSEIFHYDTEGKLLRKTSASYVALYIGALSRDSVACVRNSAIEKIKITAAEE